MLSDPSEAAGDGGQPQVRAYSEGVSLPPLVPASGHLTADDLARYSRQLVLPELGVTGQRRLAAARVLVIGAGGLGSPVLLYLAAAGVGTIGVVDSDRVETSNLHRQVIHATDSVGAPKVVSVAQALRAQNPSVAVQPHDLRLTDVNADDLIDGYDLVIDGADNFATRYLVNDACVRLGKPLVWGSVLGFAAQVSVFWDAAPEGRGLQLRDVFPEPPAPGTVPSCAEAGVVGAVCAQAGSVMAMEAVKLITGLGRPLLGRVLIIDTLAGRFDEVPVRRSTQAPARPRRVRQPRGSACESAAVPAACDVPTPAPRRVRLPEATSRLLLDVRSPAEFATEHVPGSLNVPLPTLLDGTGPALVVDEPTLVICRSGARAEIAAESLIARGFTDVQVLEGGLLALADAQQPAPG